MMRKRGLMRWLKGLMRWLKGLMLKRMHGMITCEQFEGFVLAYLDDELPAAQRRLFERHIRVCRECREYLAAYRRSMEVGRAVFPHPDGPVPEDVPEELVEAVLKSRD